MRRNRWLWGTVAISSVLLTLLFAGGFVYAVKQIVFPEQVTAGLQPQPPSGSTEEQKAEIGADGKIAIVGLGDSLTVGTGDTTGKGYILRVRDKLKEQTGKEVHVLNNLAIPGYVSEQLLHDVQQKKVKNALKEADLILFSIGGNDLFAGGAGLFNPAADMEFDPHAAAERVQPTLERIEQIVKEIHDTNPDATVLYLGLYHPFLDMDGDKKGSLIIQQFNDGVFQILNRYDKMTLVPSYDLFERDGLRYIFTDHFHPNSDGYERIADRMVQVLQ